MTTKDGVRFEISGRQAINQLGFEYSEDDTKCREHMYNNILVKLDLRHLSDYPLEKIDKNVNVIFEKVLKRELKLAGVKKVREIYWDRVFFIGKLFNPRQFTAIFYLRILGEDSLQSVDPHMEWN